MDISLFAERLEAVLVGVAMGDSLGLPYEGLSRNTVRRRLFGRRSPERHASERRSQKSPTPRLRQTFCFGHGMISDDTEQTVLVAQAMLAGRGNADRFLRSFAWRYRIWLLLLPAGIGLASLKAGLKLWLGFSPYHSGVFSAGNGPAMRSGIIGAVYHDQPTLVEEYVRLSTRMTHTDPMALTGAMVIAKLVAWQLARPIRRPTSDDVKNIRWSDVEIEEITHILRNTSSDETRWQNLVTQLLAAYSLARTPEEWADQLAGLMRSNASHHGSSVESRGVSGFVYQTVPMTIFCWLRYADMEDAFTAVIRCGGDTDTTGAIVGALVGAGCSMEQIPQTWRHSLYDQPYSLRYLRRLSLALAAMRQQPRQKTKVPYCHVWILPIRNLFFIGMILIHVVLRISHWIIAPLIDLFKR